MVLDCVYTLERRSEICCVWSKTKSCPVDVKSPRSSSSVRSDDTRTKCRICFRSGKKRLTTISVVRVFAANIAYLDVLSAWSWIPEINFPYYFLTKNNYHCHEFYSLQRLLLTALHFTAVHWIREQNDYELNRHLQWVSG